MAPTLTCRRIAARLQSRLADPSPRDDDREIQAHLSACPDCRRLEEQYRGSLAALTVHYRRVPGLPLDPAFRARLAAAPPRRPRLRGAGLAFGGLATAALLALILVGGLLLFRGAAHPLGTAQGGVSRGSQATGTAASATVICGSPAASPPPTPATDRPGATATALAATGQQPQIREDRCTRPAPGLITLEQAAVAARDFLGAPDATFTGGYVPVTTGFTGGATSYLVALHRQRPDGATDLLTVEAITGVVSGANFAIGQAATATGQPIAVGEAQARATAFARAHQPLFERLTLRGAPPSSTGDRAEFLWQRQADDGGAWLPTILRLTVSLRSGAVLAYAWSDTPYTGATAPRLTAGEALALANAAVHGEAGFTGPNAQVTVLEARPAYTINGEQATPRLVWIVTFQQRATSIYVDALTGELLRGAPRG